MPNPDLATEVTLQPLARFPLDAAIVFSDILTIPDAMGLGLYFAEGEGPQFERPLRDEREIRDLAVPDPAEHLRYVVDTVAQMRRTLAGKRAADRVLGQSLHARVLHGRGRRRARISSTSRRCCTGGPNCCTASCDVNARAVTAYLNAQIEAGAQAVMIFDTWGGALGHAAYREFSLAYMQQVLDGLARERDGMRVPNIVFTKGGGAWLESHRRERAATPWGSTGRWTSERRASASARASALQGNLEPAMLLAEAGDAYAKAWRACSRITAAAAATCSISVTAYPGSHRRKTSEFWSKPCTSFPGAYH